MLKIPDKKARVQNDPTICSLAFSLSFFFDLTEFTFSKTHKPEKYP